jgi:uncharacterized protein YkwD
MSIIGAEFHFCGWSENSLDRAIWTVDMTQPSALRRRFGAAALTFMVLLGVTSGTQAARAATAQETSIATAVFNQLNAERKAHGLPALRMNVYLVKAARSHNLMMAKYNTLSHQLPGEPVFTTRITNAGYRWSSAGENIAWTSNRTQSGALALQSMLYNETPPNDPHRLIILNTRYRDVGVDVLIDNTHAKLWLTEDFASPL